MPLIILKYSELTTIDGAVIGAGVWTRVPINGVVRDDGDNCNLNIDNTFTIATRVYPKICRFNLNTTIVNSTGGALVAKSRLVLLKSTGSQVIDTSLNFKLITLQSQGIVKQFLSTQIIGPSTFSLEVWSNIVAIFGKAAADGSEEKYSSVELTVE